MTKDTDRFSEDEIARAIGYARVKGDRLQRQGGRKVLRRHTLPSIPGLRAGARRIAHA